MKTDLQKRRRGTRIILAGDFNAKSHVWGCERNDNRCGLLAEWLTELNLYVANKGRESTFSRRETHCIIDIIACSENIVTHVRGWRVLEQESLPDHKYIMFHVTNKQGERKPIKPKWKINPNYMGSFNTNFGRVLKDHQSDNAYNIDAETLDELVKKACDLTFPRKKTDYRRREVYWWNRDIADARKLCSTKRRTITRANGNNKINDRDKAAMWQEYKTHKRLLKKKIFQAKNDAWKQICEELQEDVWGRAYQIVCRETSQLSSAHMTDEKTFEVAKGLLPEVKAHE